MDVTSGWLPDRSEGNLAIPGTTDPDHLESDIAAAAVSLRDDELRRPADAAD